MSEISTSASYIRSPEARQSPRDVRGRSQHGGSFESVTLEEDRCDRAWELLETPQTVETISRVLAAESGMTAETFRPRVASLLAHLLAQELIVLSPDS